MSIRPGSLTARRKKALILMMIIATVTDIIIHKAIFPIITLTIRVGLIVTSSTLSPNHTHVWKCNLCLTTSRKYYVYPQCSDT